MITVISQTQKEIEEETREIFMKIKPFLDKNYSFNQAFRKAGLLNENQSCKARKWTRDVVEYAKKQGYDGG